MAVCLNIPAHSKAWDAFGIMKPTTGAGWQRDHDLGVWVCYVEQGHTATTSQTYVAFAARLRREDLPELNWTKGEQRLPDWMIERYGYESGRIGVVAMIGGKDKTAKRNATRCRFVTC